MEILVLPISFIVLFFSIGVLISSATIKELVLNTVLVFCGFVLLITELTSAFRALNFYSILFSWIGILLLNLVFLAIKKASLLIFIKKLTAEIKYLSLKLKGVTIYQKCLLLFVGLILLLVFVQGIIYPPNSMDALNYHLARIPSWISHQSVAHYPTGVVRQIYQPPFAEFVILHFNILSKHDYFSNCVQLLFLFFSIVGIVAITEIFGLTLSYKILAVLLSLTIPEVILQATTTQNDIVVSFFVITAFYFAVRSIKKFDTKNTVFFGFAIGLGILTKATAYIYMPALVMIFGVTLILRLLTLKNYRYLWHALLFGLVFLTINFGFYYRNYKLANNFLGVDRKEYKSYSNEKMSTGILFSSILKNVGNHIGLFHFKRLSVFSAETVIKINQAAGIDINDPANNYFNEQKYETIYFPAHPDLAPNFIHLILILTAFTILLFNRKKINLYVLLLFLTIIFQWFLFCFYLKWQPYHTRLHTSIFLLAVPLICYAVKIVGNQVKKFFYYLNPLLLGYAVMVIFANMSAPYNATIKKTRYEKYFLANPFIFKEYQGINETIKKSSYKNVGLIMDDSNPEYPLFTDCYSKPINPVYINVNNYTKNCKTDLDNIDCIVANSTCNQPFLDFNGKRFYNQDPENKFIHLYR